MSKFEHWLYRSELYVARQLADTTSAQEKASVDQQEVVAEQAVIKPAPNTIVLIQDDEGGIIFTSRSDGKINIVLKAEP